jgi:hypothetical protein
MGRSPLAGSSSPYGPGAVVFACALPTQGGRPIVARRLISPSANQAYPKEATGGWQSLLVGPAVCDAPPDFAGSNRLRQPLLGMAPRKWNGEATAGRSPDALRRA